jgi:acetyl-CoA acetyltransferase
MKSSDAAIIGVGLTPFGKFKEKSLKDLAGEAINEALLDGGLSVDDIEMAFVANALSSVITRQVAVIGQVVLSAVGFAGIPVYNIDNACAGSSSALNLAVQAIRAGAARHVLVVGVEKMYSDDRAATYRALNGAADMEWVVGTGVDVERESVFVKEVYPARIRAYRARNDLRPETLAKIAVKNRQHAVANPLAQYRQPLTVDEVLAARTVTEPLTTLMCAPIGDGASAAIVSAAYAVRRSDHRPVWIRGSAVSMGSPSGGGEGTIARLAQDVFQQAGVGPAQVDVAEVHDSTAFSELLAYEELGFCPTGGGSALVDSGDTALGGRIPVNPSGGLESRGHPVAATGLAQVIELVLQIRGEAGDRQIRGAKVGLAESAGGYVNGDSAAVAVTLVSSDACTRDDASR